MVELAANVNGPRPFRRSATRTATFASLRHREKAGAADEARSSATRSVGGSARMSVGRRRRMGRRDDGTAMGRMGDAPTHGPSRGERHSPRLLRLSCVFARSASSPMTVPRFSGARSFAERCRTTRCHDRRGAIIEVSRRVTFRRAPVGRRSSSRRASSTFTFMAAMVPTSWTPTRPATDGSASITRGTARPRSAATTLSGITADFTGRWRRLHALLPSRIGAAKSSASTSKAPTSIAERAGAQDRPRSVPPTSTKSRAARAAPRLRWM